MPRQLVFTLETRPKETATTPPDDSNCHSIFMRGTEQKKYNEILTLHMFWGDMQPPNKESDNKNLWHLPKPLRQPKEHKAEELVLKTSIPTKDDPHKHTRYERDSIATEQVSRKLRALRKSWDVPFRLLVVRYTGSFRVSMLDDETSTRYDFMMECTAWVKPGEVYPTTVDFYNHVIQPLRFWAADVLFVLEDEMLTPWRIQALEKAIHPPPPDYSHERHFTFGEDDDDDGVDVEPSKTANSGYHCCGGPARPDDVNGRYARYSTNSSNI